MRWNFLEGQKRYMLQNCKGNTFFGIHRSHDTQKEAHDMVLNVCSEEREILFKYDKRFCKSHNIGRETAETCSCI